MAIPVMQYNPISGTPKPFPTLAENFREFYPGTSWLYNPWTRVARSAEEICSDPYGKRILPPTVAADNALLSRAYALLAAFQRHIDNSCDGDHPDADELNAWLEEYQSC